MRFIFDGAEVPSNRKLLEQMGVTRFGVNYYRMTQRYIPKTKEWLIPDRFKTEGAKVYLHPGTSIPPERMEEIFSLYRRSFDLNREWVAGALEFDPHPVLAGAMRQEWDEDLMWAVWSHTTSAEGLESMAQRFKHIAIPYATIEGVPGLSTRCHMLTQQYGTVWHGIGCAKPDNLRQIPFTTATTMAWLGPMRRGETIIWEGSKLHRYPTGMKNEIRPRYTALYEKIGLDVDLILADKATEVAKLAVWSLLQFEKYWDPSHGRVDLDDGVRNRGGGVSYSDADSFGGMGHFGHGVANSGSNPLFLTGGLEGNSEGGSKSAQGDSKGNADRTPETSDKSSDIDDISDTPAGTEDAVSMSPDSGGPDTSVTARGTELVIRDPSRMAFLPSLGYEEREEVDTSEDGTEILRNRRHVTSQDASMRQCDTCFVADNCPAFVPHHTCAFKIPMEVRTRDQLKSLLESVIEMQGQRVAFARFVEETKGGGYPDPTVSVEIDRLFKVTESYKKVMEERRTEYARLTLEAETSGQNGESGPSPAGGLMSALFGPDKAQPLNTLPSPLSSDLIIKKEIED